MWARVATLALALTAQVSGTPQAPPQPDPLRLDLTAGSSELYRAQQRQSIRLDVGALPGRILETVATVDLRQTVRGKREDGTHVVDVVYERVQLELATDGRTLKFDTDGVPADGDRPLVALRDALIGRRLTVEVTDRGRIEAVDGIDEAWERLGAVGEGPLTAGVLGRVMAEAFDAEALRTMLQQGRITFPEEPIAEGDGWVADESIEHASLGPLDVRSRFRYESDEQRGGRDCLRVSIAGSMRFTADRPLADFLATSLAGRGEFALTADAPAVVTSGTAWVERDTGLQVALEMETSLDLDLAYREPRSTGDDALDVRLSIDGVLTVERQEPQG